MTTAVDRELADYKQVASDLRVGVNHLALDEERLRQEKFLQGLVDLQHHIFEDENLKQRYSDEVEELKNGIRLNADVLSYLKGVTKLEAPLTELTNKVTQAAIAASSPSAATPAVFANKALTENVNNCWEYIAQLSAITQTHLKDAASYHQFHHMANEVDAHIDKMIGLAEMKMVLFDPQGTVDEAVLLAKELEGDHIELARTWEQTCQLTEMARHLKPVQNRLARVVCGRTVDTSPEMAGNIVMVKALISFSGPDFAIRKGEEMILMKNENPNFWSVKTTFGEREVPSVIFSTIGPNQEEVFKANSLQRKCVSDWKRVLERNKGRLVKYYTKLFEQYCQNEAIYFAHEDAMNDFLDDLDSTLIASNYDSGILHRAYDKFTNTLMLLSPNRRPPRGAISLTEQDIRALHAPLRRVLNQATHVDQVQSRVSMSAEEVQRYLKSVEDERQNIFNEISRMEQLQKEKEIQLKSLQQRMTSWKTKRQAFDQAIGDYNLEPLEDIMKSFPSTPFSKLRVVENDYRSGGNHYEMNLDEASSNETQSSSYYGKVAKQIVTSHTRPKANGVTFVGEVVKDGEGGSKVWSGNAAILKRSASTNDLQTQILRVTMNTGVQYDHEDHKLAFADISELRKNDQTIGTADVQSQILRVTRNATSQVGVRVTPKAIDLSRVDIGNLGLEVLNSKETEGLGFRVGEVLCPVSVGTSVNLYEGPGVQVLGINDVDSLNLELRNAIAHATKDSHRGLKIHDVQSQIITRTSSESAWSETQASSEVQAQIGVMNRTAAIQAVAKMGVVNIPSHTQKSRVAEATSTAFCLLPDKESTGTVNSEAATSDVMTQISCILHSRGIHSDLQTYLSEYKKRCSLSETSDLGEQSPNVRFQWERQPNSEIRSSTATCDVETLIRGVAHDYGTQVSSRLIPTEVTVSNISTKNMAISLSNPLKELDIGLPIDSLICPSDMKFRTELYEGSDLLIADYSGVGNFIVTHSDGVVTGSMHLSSVDTQTHHDRGLKTQAAVVLRAKDFKSKVEVGEITAQPGVAPKVNFVVSNVAGRPFRDSKTPTSDLETQIRSSNLPQEDGGKSVELIESEAEFIRRNENIFEECSIPGTKSEVGQGSFNFEKEVMCVKCQKKYREIPSQYEKKVSEHNDLQSNISNIVTSKGIQHESNDMQYSGYSYRRQLVNSEVQVGLELVPTQISMKRYDIEKMEVEFLDATEHENYNVKMNSISCPARIKVESRLTEGSGVHISGIEKASRVVINVSSSLPSVREDVTERIEDEDPDILHEEFKTEVNFEHTSGSMDERRRYSSKSTQRNLIRLIPCGVAGCKKKTSSETSQVLSVTSDASMQVGSRLVPLAIGVSPVQLENMEISLTKLGKPMSGQTPSASAVLYPAQVELQSTLVDGQSGIELIPIEQLEYINMNSSRSEAMIQYSSSSSDVITQIITPERPNLLPASIVMETGQFDGHRRIPNIASQSLVYDLLSNRIRNQTITIRAKPATSDYFSGKTSSYLGYVSTEATTQTADTSIENMEEESNSAADKPPRRVKQHAVGVQVGTKLIPEVLKLSQIPVKNMKLESSFSSSGQQESINLQSVRCPAEIAMKSELCDDSGIVICSLDQSGEIEVEMACDGPEPRIVTNEQFAGKTNKVYGWWSGIVSGKSSLFEDKSLKNSPARKSAENAIATSEKPIRIEKNLSLQGEAILQPETYTTHSNPRYKLVIVDSENQNRSTSQKNSVSPDRQYSSVSASKLNWRDRGIQVGVKLIPNSIDVKPLKLENMKAVLSSKTTLGAREVDVGAVLCTSGVQYGEELTETTGVQVVQINESDELSLCYCGDKFLTSVMAANKCASVIGSTDGSKHFDVGSITARNEDHNTTPDADDSNFITILRVKEAQYGTENKRTAGYWEGAKRPSGEITFVQNRTHLMDKNVQVGLDLIPKTITVDKVSVENMELISGQMKHGIFDQVSVGAMLHSSSTQYDQILTESKGVRVLPIGNAHDVRVGYNGDTFCASVDSSRDLIEASYSESRSDWPRLRVRHLEFSGEVGHVETINRIEESSKVEAMTQVGAVLVPTELKLEHMSLDSCQVPRLVESISTKNILCPTDIVASSILSECSGVHIISVGGLSEIALRLGQAEYKAEIKRDTKSNQTQISIKEGSFSAKTPHASGYVSLIEPSPSIDYAQQDLTFGGMTNSTLHSMSSKSVQVGTILIPTTVTMEKVMVENLEVSVPLNQSRSAEINVSAVLASSATEMTTVLTNAPGIHVIPMSKMDKVGIQVSGKNYIGMVDGAYQSACGRAPSSISMCQDQEKIVLPITSSTSSRRGNIQTSLLHQSADLRLVHDALRTGQTTPVLKESNSLSTGSFRRPGIIHIPGQTLTPITEISSTPSHSVQMADFGGEVEVDTISSQSRVHESYHVTCEAAIKPAMVSKRLTVNIQPVGIDAGCQVSTHEVDYSMDTRLSRHQLSQLTTDDMTSELMDTPNLLRRTPSKKRIHSEESHGKARTANTCSSCRRRVMITDISKAEPDDPNRYKASIRIRRASNADTFDNSVSTNLSRESTLRRSFFTWGSDKRSRGSFESLRSYSVASRCAICRNEITSGDLSSSIRTSTSSLLGGGETAVVRDSRVIEIADAYAQICGEADRSDRERANLYLMLRSNEIIEAVIDDYEKEKHIEEYGYFAEGKEIVEIVSTNENATGKSRSGDNTIYSQLRNNSLTQKVIDSYEWYKHSMRVDEFIQVSSTPVQRDVSPAGDEVQEIIDVVNALKDADGQVGEKTIYGELKGNAIIQRVIKEYEVSRLAHTTVRRPSTSSRLMDVVSSRDSKIGILSVDGQIAKMEFEQFSTSDLVGRGSVSIFQRYKGTESREKPLSSSVSSVSGDEDTTDMWRTSEVVTPANIRYDVAVSALITPETWDKKVQFDSSNPR